MTQYALPIDGDAYFATKLKHTTWDSTTTDDKTRALSEAQRLVDHLNYEGDKTNPAQTSEFPRGGDVAVPLDIVYATIEIANALLDGYDPDLATENLNNELIGYSGVHVRSDHTSSPVHLVNQIPSVVAWNYLRPYLRDPSTLIMSRVN